MARITLSKFDKISRNEPKCNPFGAVKTGYKGMIFDSKGEMLRFILLESKQAAGEISELRRQVPFKLFNKHGQYESSYYADFTYIWRGRLIVEDYKGIRTDVYKQKRRLMKECHGITILETRFRKR